MAEGVFVSTWRGNTAGGILSTMDRGSFRLCVLAMGLCGFVAWAPGRAVAQTDRGPDAFLNQQRALLEQVREDFDSEQPATQKVDLDYGGSYSLNFFLYDDGVNSSRTLRRHDLRVWTRLGLDGGAHEFFARVRQSYLDFNTGDSYDGNDDDWEGPNLERGFYQFDLRKALKAYADSHIPYNLRVKVGRDLAELGTGLTLSQTLDQVWAEAQVGDFELAGLVGRTVGSSYDIDRTRDIERTRRAFFGAQVVYAGLERHRPFVYVLWQRDHNHDAFPSPLQDFDYDSFYVGLGSTGELFRNLRYSTEWVYESGHGYGHRRFLKEDVVRAWAFDAELEYLSDAKGHPRVSVEYIAATAGSQRGTLWSRK